MACSSCVWVCARVSILFCTSLFVVLTAVVMSAMLSVVASSRTYNFVAKPAVVSSRQLVIPCNTSSIWVMCFLVRCMVESFAIKWDLFVLTAEAIS